MGTVGYKHIDFSDRKMIEKMYKDYSDNKIAERIKKSQQSVSLELKRLNREDYTAKKAQKDLWRQYQARSLSLPRMGVDRRCRDCVNKCLRSNPNMEPDDIAELFDLDIEDVKKVFKNRQKRLNRKK